MAPRQHCDEIIRLIDEVLGDSRRDDRFHEPRPASVTPMAIGTVPNVEAILDALRRGGFLPAR